MGRGDGPTRDRTPLGPPGEDVPPFDMGPPGWGPPPPGGWGPPPSGGWGLPPPEGWGPRGPPPPDWDLRGPSPPEWGRPYDWGPSGSPSPDWDPRLPPPPDWDPRGPPPPGWGPRGPPPPDWDPRGPPPPDWDPRGPPPPAWGPYPDDWVPPPDWRRPPHWRGWGPECPDPWGPGAVSPVPPVPPVPPVLPPGLPPPGLPPPGLPPPGLPPPGLPPPAPIVIPPPDPAAVPPVPPLGCMPPFGFPPPFPAPVWTAEPVAEEPMPNPPPDQPEWIKALISAPPSDSTPVETKKDSEVPAVTKAAPPDPAPAAAPTPPAAPKPEPRHTAKALGLLGKRTFERPPPGRSTGIISFVGPTFGSIEREDLEKFQFSFDVFFGNPNALTPGVRVHFTACKEKNRAVATDVKVAPGGTENVDPEIYEAVVSQAIEEPQPGDRQYPGQVHVTLGMVRTNLAFERKDSTVTLLKDDQVLINVLTDIVTEKRRATNIRPKIPATFGSTRETREKGVIVSLKENEGIIQSEEHGELQFETRENLSDVDFTEEDINEEVEFTVLPLRGGKRAVRIKRVKEPLLLTLCGASSSAPEELERTNGEMVSVGPNRTRSKSREELEPHMVLDSELYEGIVSQTIIEPKLDVPGYPGQIVANIGPLRTNVTFDHRDCSVTLLKNDHVLINLLINTLTNKRRAANIRPKIPFTFRYTKEVREQGTIASLGDQKGVVSSTKHGDLPFDLCENFSDAEFDSDDVGKDVEFTVTTEKAEVRAIRLRRMRRSKAAEDKILQEQKARELEERQRREEEEAERRRKEEAAAALAAAKDKWTPFGFRYRVADSMLEVSRERFQGTVLKAICRSPPKEPREEQEEAKQEGDVKEEEMAAKETQEEKGGTEQVKQEETEDGEQQEATGLTGRKEMQGEQEEQIVAPSPPAPEVGRLVMTVDGRQKQLSFGPNDLLSLATMLVGDKVRFSLATHRLTKEERATFIEILPDSFEESTEQRMHGIVIEFSEDSGLIKCSENPQLFFKMSEVVEKKKLELNEKVEFSIVPHPTADGGQQAIRIKRFTEKVFLPVRKLSGVGATKGKMTIKLAKPPDGTENQKPEADKQKAVFKTIKKDTSVSRHKYRRSRSKERSKSRSPSKDQFGRVAKKRRSVSVDRERSSRYRRSRERSSRRSRSRSQSRSSSCSRSRSRSRSREKSSRKRSRSSKEREDSHRRRPSPAPRRGVVVDTELARKKRELEELNEMIAYKKSLVDPRGLEPGGRTCIDYDHGRISMPRSILKKRPEEPDYIRPPYDDPYYDRPYGLFPGRRYGEPYSDPYPHPYADRPYADRPYDSRLYGDPPYGGAPSSSHRYTDRYDVYNEHYDSHFYDSAYRDRPYDLYPPVKRSRSPEPRVSSPHSPPSLDANLSAKSLTHSVSTFRPPSPIDSPPKTPSPKRKFTTPPQSPPAQKPPLHRFLDMLNKKTVAEKTSEPLDVTDDLLPHERALQDGKGFSRIVGLAQECPSSSLVHEVEIKQPNSKQPSVEKTGDGQNPEPYDKIQSLLRSIGLKLSSGEVPKLANKAQDKTLSFKSSSMEREMFPKEELRSGRTGSVEMDRIHSPSPARSSSIEPLTNPEPAVSEYEKFFDQHDFEERKKAQHLHSHTKSTGSAPPTVSSPKPPPGPPPAHYQHPTPPLNWPLGITATSHGPDAPAAAAQPHPRLLRPPGPPPGPPPRRQAQHPPGPPPGPPPQRPAGLPPFTTASTHTVLPFIGQASPTSAAGGASSLKPTPTPTVTSVTSSPSSCDQSAMSTTVVRCLNLIETVKSLSTPPPAKPVKSVQFSLPSVSFSSSPPSLETDDDIKAKQKEKLDLYNQRLLEKREQEYKERLTLRRQGERSKEGPPVPAGKPISTEPKNVWICGHSLVYWAESRAKSPEVGMQLGMDPNKVTIWWKGIQGMTWSQLLPQLHQLKITWPNPDALIVHLGGNDLSTESPTNLLASVKKDMASIRSIFPHCLLVWSDILPRRVWRHSPDSYEVDLVRTTVNRRIHSIVSDLGGVSVNHDNIRCGTNTGLYRGDGIHLSPKGIDVFNLNLQEFLEKWELEVNSQKAPGV